MPKKTGRLEDGPVCLNYINPMLTDLLQLRALQGREIYSSHQSFGNVEFIPSVVPPSLHWPSDFQKGPLMGSGALPL